MRVDIPDLRAGKGGVDGHDFIACGNNPGNRLRPYAHQRYPERRERPDVAGQQRGARPYHRFALRRLLAFAHQICPGADGLKDVAAAVAVILRIFDHYDGVGAFGQHSARGYRGAFADPDRDGGTFAHGNAPAKAQLRGDGGAAAKGIGRADGETVNRRTVKARNIFPRCDVLEQNAAAGVEYRHRFIAGIKFAEAYFALFEHVARGGDLKHKCPLFRCRKGGSHISTTISA